MTPLMCAALKGDGLMARKILAAGADVALRNADGNNALWLACVERHLDMIDLLIEAGIDIDNRNDGGATVSTNGGKTWTNVTPPDLTPWSKVVMMEASHFDVNEAYAAVDGHVTGDYAPLLFRTRDWGATWTRAPTCSVSAWCSTSWRRGSGRSRGRPAST